MSSPPMPQPIRRRRRPGTPERRGPGSTQFARLPGVHRRARQGTASSVVIIRAADRAALGAEQSRPTCRVTSPFGIVRGRRPARTVHGQELDREPDGPFGCHLVVHLRWQGLGRARCHDDVDRRCGGENAAQLSLVDDEDPPGPITQSVPPAQAGRRRLLRPIRAGSHGTQRRRKFGSIAQGTRQLSPEPALPILGGERPLPELERGPVPDVLIVSAREFCDPLALGISPVTGDRALH